MEKTSDKYSTYAEYVRRTLLRLRIVEGLSDELRTLIVIRRIDSPQVRAAAANAELTTNTIVSFLSIYTKPNKVKPDKPASSEHTVHQSLNARSGPRCFSCGLRGHVSKDCKRSKSNAAPNTQSGSSKLCTFYKKQGHTEDACFVKARSALRNPHNAHIKSTIRGITT